MALVKAGLQDAEGNPKLAEWATLTMDDVAYETHQEMIRWCEEEDVDVLYVGGMETKPGQQENFRKFMTMKFPSVMSVFKSKRPFHEKLLAVFVVIPLGIGVRMLARSINKSLPLNRTYFRIEDETKALLFKMRFQ